MDRQTCTDPTFSDLLKLMGLRSGLKDEYLYMEEELDYFLQYDMEFVNEADFYEELCILGKATRKAVDSALSQSGEFLSCLMDVDGIFQSSKTACLRLAANIMVFIDRGADVDPMEAADLMDLRQTLGNKFARMKGSWENLLRSAMTNRRYFTKYRSWWRSQKQQQTRPCSARKTFYNPYENAIYRTGSGVIRMIPPSPTRT